MAFPNDITISGTLCNVEMKQAQSGNFYLTGGLKVYQGKEKDAGWFDVVAFNNERNRLADNLADCFTAGTKSLPVILKGKLEQGSYENQEGKTVKTYKIIIDEAAISVVFGPVTLNSGSDTVQTNSEPDFARPLDEIPEGEAPF